MSKQLHKEARAERVVIVGGGFGGLYTAKALQDAPVDVTLIDKRNFHLFQPLLYQVATGGGPFPLVEANEFDRLFGNPTAAQQPLLEDHKR